MLPKYHAIFGLISSILAYFMLPITLFQASLIFFASFLIDFDHYIWYVYKKRDFSLKRAYFYLKNKVDKKPHLMIFHTIEFLALIAILAYFIPIFIFILIGMLFHSILDVINLSYRNSLNSREFSLIRGLVRIRV